jgi:RNA polymerase sigma-70 factor (ECF subfamily)
LCGFSVSEIAGAFLSGEAAIEKRIARAKKVLAGSKTLFDLQASSDFAARLPAAQRALYLLFNEGYHGACAESAVRVELCREAMRLTALLVEHPLGATPATEALLALMCLHAGRMPARVDALGNLSPLAEQDRSLWDWALIHEGKSRLERSAAGPEVTEYHVEAAIAGVHGSARRAEDTRWEMIVALYDALLVLRPSPVVALNRAIAVAEHEGPERGLAEIRAIEGVERLHAYPFYAAALGELEFRCGRRDVACEHFCRALALARNATERRFWEQRVSACAAG